MRKQTEKFHFEAVWLNKCNLTNALFYPSRRYYHDVRWLLLSPMCAFYNTRNARIVYFVNKFYPILKLYIYLTRSPFLLQIRVTDMNDNAPMFPRSEYDVNVTEYAAIGTDVIRIAAMDADTGLNAMINYHISNGDDHFGIREIAGGMSLYTRKPLDREMRNSYQMTISAADHGIPPLTGTTTVLVWLSFLAHLSRRRTVRRPSVRPSSVVLPA